MIFKSMCAVFRLPFSYEVTVARVGCLRCLASMPSPGFIARRAWLVVPDAVVPRRCFSLSRALCSNFMHQQKENDHVHSALQQISRYADLLSPPKPVVDHQTLSEAEFEALLSMDWTESEQLVAGFKRVSQHVHGCDIDISDEKFDSLSQAMVQYSGQLNYEQFCEVLSCLALWKTTNSTKSHNFMEVWNALDQACGKNIASWNNTQLLRMCDLWHQLSLGGINHFNWLAINRLSRRTSHLTREQIVLALFFINLRRNFPPALDVISYQIRLEQVADDLTMPELAACALGFFKTQKKVHVAALMKKVIAKTMADASTAHSVEIAAILKICRSSLHIEQVDQLYALLCALQPRLVDLPLVACIHVALAGSNVQMVHREVMATVVQRVVAELSTSRIKDIERFAFVSSLFNWPAELPGKPGTNMYEMLASEAVRPERESEVARHPRCITNLLHFLAIRGVYPLHLIDKCLSFEFIGSVYSSAMKHIGLEMLCLDVAVEVERPDYKGHRLDMKTRRHLARTVSMHPTKWRLGTGAASNRHLADLIEGASAMTKDENKFCVCHVLPNYFRPDLVFRLNKENPTQLLPITAEVRDAELGVIRRPLESGIWVCLVLGSVNLLVRGSTEPIGSITQKLRMLRALGYDPVLVPWLELQQAPNKPQYIASLLNAVAEHYKSQTSLSN